MLETLLKLYFMAMAGDVRSPTPHLVGPPGSGKSTVVAELANLAGVKMHTINVSRLSPLEIEGVQMPINENTELHMLLSTLWTNLNEGDIVLWDEFLRGFPEVYNGLLDIFSAREVAGHQLPKVFFVAASNSTTAYDEALRDRLMHIKVPDLRTDKAALRDAKARLVEELGLLPTMVDSMEMTNLFATEVHPMYKMLDSYGKGSGSPMLSEGHSPRNLIGQARMRHVQSAALKELIDMNNNAAIRGGKYQYVFLIDGRNVDQKYEAHAQQLVGNEKLTELQAHNLECNLQLIQMEQLRRQKEGTDTDDDELLDDDVFS